MDVFEVIQHKDKEEYDINIYLNSKDVRKLATGENLRMEKEKISGEIYPASKAHMKMENEGHYDDVLDALEEVYSFIEQIEYSNPELLRYAETEKLKNTYKHYKQIQERHQQTNK